jgi:hypothetical protein
MKKPILLAILIGMIAANFLYQAVIGQHWDSAFERSWFQAIAIGSVFIAHKLFV